MEDVCQRYDLDGLELDWLRISTFFQSTRDLRPVEPKHIAIMNDFVRRIRTMTDRVGRERGRPLLISCRVPRTLKHSLDVGLDIRTCLKEDLVDVLVLGGGYAPMAMAREIRAIADLTHQYDVPLYGCISESGIGLLRRSLYSSDEPEIPFESDEAWRGAAMNAWHAGEDSIYTFNFFPNRRVRRFDQLGSLETLGGGGQDLCRGLLDKNHVGRSAQDGK